MKIACLIISLMLIFCGWLGYSHTSFQKKLDEKISAKEWISAENILGEYDKTTACRLLKNIPRIKQELAFQKGWLMSQRGDCEGAIKEFRKAANISSPLKNDSIYNAATLALAEGRESLEKLAEDYIKVLAPPNSEDFKARVNLEIVKILQQKAKTQMPAPGQEGEQKKGKIKQYRPGDKDKDGQGSSPDDSKIRY